jgi:hypothetical protein
MTIVIPCQEYHDEIRRQTLGRQQQKIAILNINSKIQQQNTTAKYNSKIQ